MEDLELKDVLNIFQQKILLIITITVVITTVGILYTMFIQKPIYNSDVTMVLTAPINNAESNVSSDRITQNDVLLNQKLVSTYSEIIKSRKLAGQVISNLKLDYKPEKLAEMIIVNSKKDTEMLQIRVLDEDPKLASQIANNLAEVFSKEIISIYNIKNVSIIDKGEVSDSPYNVSIAKQIIMFFCVGIVLSLVLVFAIYYFDTSVKDPDQVEKKLGMYILSTIPIYKNK